jgi:cystathionine gamma-synthase
MKSEKLSTLVARAGSMADSSGHVVPPIAMSTTFARDGEQRLLSGVDYGRDGSPMYPPLEALLSKLDRGVAALVFSSGLAAAHAVLMSLRPGDHLIIPQACYWGFRKLAMQFAADWGIALSLVDFTDSSQLAAALKPGQTKLVWVETPANPCWEVTDLREVVRLAKSAGAAVCVDSTVPTPVLTRPIELGADLVLHSATKYLNGHSDVLAGALITAQLDERWQRICTHRHDAGAVLGNVEAWLLLRGLKTLEVRVRRCSQTALELATRLEPHPALHAVLYPGLASHPGHALARSQMDGGFSGMMSLRFAGGEAAALAFCSKLRVFVRATSLGATESLAEHRATVEGPASRVPRDLVRLSIGLEDVEDLYEDLLQALTV